MPLTRPMKVFHPRQPKNPLIQRPKSDKNDKTHPGLAVRDHAILRAGVRTSLKDGGNGFKSKHPAVNIQI